MRLIKLQLKNSVPFWSLGLIKLNSDYRTSDFIDVDALSETNVNIIQSSKDHGLINLIDTNNNFVKSIIGTQYLNESLIDTEDVEEEEEEIEVESIKSVTISLEDEEIKGSLSVEDFYEEALIMTKKNGNTLKKIIQNLDNDEETKYLIRACIKVEKENKNRVKILEAFKRKINEQ